MRKYELLAISTYRNRDGMYEVNDLVRTNKYIYVHENDSDAAVLRKARKVADITARCKYECITANEYRYEFRIASSGKPAIYLESVHEYTPSVAYTQESRTRTDGSKDSFITTRCSLKYSILCSRRNSTEWTIFFHSRWHRVYIDMDTGKYYILVKKERIEVLLVKE